MKISFRDVLSYLLSAGWINSPPTYSEYVFSFEEYVKGFLHSPISAEILERDVVSYLGAIRYLEGNLDYQKECSMVLKYFYEDLFYLLVKTIQSGTDHRIRIEIDKGSLKSFPVKSFNSQDILQEIASCLNEPEDFSLASYRLISRVSMDRLSERLEKYETALAYATGYLSETSPAVLEVIQ